MAITGEAGAILGDMVSEITRTADLVHEIAAAVREQSAGTAQIAGAVGSLDRSTRKQRMEPPRLRIAEAA